MVARVEDTKGRPRTPRLSLWLHTALVVLAVGFPVVFGLASTATPFGYRWVIPADTGSMEPVFDSRSLVIERRTDTERLRIGDVIDFTRPSDGKRILHRIVDIREDSGGSRWFTTKGDANESPDREQITLEVGDTYGVIANIPNGGPASAMVWASLMAISLFALGVRLRLRARAQGAPLLSVLSGVALGIPIVLVAGLIGSLLRIFLV